MLPSSQPRGSKECPMGSSRLAPKSRQLRVHGTGQMSPRQNLQAPPNHCFVDSLWEFGHGNKNTNKKQLFGGVADDRNRV